MKGTLIFDPFLPSVVYSPMNIYIHIAVLDVINLEMFSNILLRVQLEGMRHHWKNKGQCLLIEVLAHQTLQDQQRKPFR